MPKSARFGESSELNCCRKVSNSSGLSMASTGSAADAQNPKQATGFLANAIKRKHSFIQFAAMTGILLLSVRSLGQKYRIHDLEDDTWALKEEQETLADRMKNIKEALLQEASLEPTGRFASRLRGLFSEQDSN